MSKLPQGALLGARVDGVHRPRFSVLVASRNRPSELRRCLHSIAQQIPESDEIIVLDDASETPLEETLPKDFQAPAITWIRSDKPSGVSGARNRLVEASKGEILVFLDDDASILSSSFFETISGAFKLGNGLGILAFRIFLDFEGSEMLQVPFSRGAIRRSASIVNQRQKVGYFVGAGHAISRSVFEACGLYPEDFVYGHEELDLSYRAINSGFTIAYDPTVTILHQPAPSQVDPSHKTKRQEHYYLTRNRIWLAYRNLPWRNAIVYVSFWSTYYLLTGIRKRVLSQWLRGIKDGLLSLSRTKRAPLSPRSIAYLKANHGRLWR